MKIKNKIAFTLLLLFICKQLPGQVWTEFLSEKKTRQDKISFYEIKNAFDKYWQSKNTDDKSVIKGKGYKPYKRWENWMVPRAYPDGFIPENQAWSELQKEKRKSVLKNSPVSDWKSIGPDRVPLDFQNNPTGIGRINCIAFHPSNPNIIYTGSPSGGFWKTNDGGLTWATTSDNLPGIGISDIAINPDNPDIIYIATGDGDALDTYSIGILKSTNGGNTWNTTGLSYSSTEKRVMRKLLINPLKPDTLIVATSTGILLSNDAGLNWNLVQTGNFKDLEFKNGNPEIIYAARYGTNSSKLYKSINGGVSFTEIITGVDLSKTYRLELATAGTDFPEVLYAVYSNSVDDGFHSFWKSDNSGATWTKLYDYNNSNLLGWSYDGSDDGGQGWFDLSLAVSPTNSNEVYLGGINIWKSINSGTSWQLTGHWSGSFAPYVHADHHHLVYSPSGILFNGNDGGIYKTANGGLSWTDLSKGLQILQIDRIGISQTDSKICLVGNQDNGSMKFDGKNGKWVQIFGGDGCECIVDYTNDQTIYFSYIKGDIKRSDDGGFTNKSIKPDEAGNGVWHTPIIMNPKNNKTLYAGFSDVWKSNDKGENWSKISNNLSPANSPLTQMAVASSDTNFMYVTNGPNFWKSKDGGISWDQIINSELSGLYITYIAIDNTKPEKLWISVSGYFEGKKVYCSENAGESWNNYSTDLPNLPVNCIVREDSSNDVLYIGTDIGVYYRDASLKSWLPFKNGLPNVEVSELEINYTLHSLVAGTKGRGLYETTIPLSGTFESVFSECFDGANLPSGWGIEVLNNPNGNAPAIDFITTSINPANFQPVKCSHFARFNSFTCESGDKMRLKMINAISVVACDSLRLSFYATVDNQYDDTKDTIITQYSFNGSAWFNLDTIIRYSSEGDNWIKNINTLPDAAENQNELYLGFLFISAYGNDMHIDNVVLEKVYPEPPRFVSSSSNESGTEIEIRFNVEMGDPSGKTLEFEIDNGNFFQPSTIQLKSSDNHCYIFGFPVAIQFGQNINLSYTKGSVVSANGGILESFVNKTVMNKVGDPNSIPQNESLKSFQVYPNPNSGNFEIQFNDNYCQTSEMRIFSMEGKLVFNKKLKNIKKNDKLSIDLGLKLKGLYLLELKTCGKQFLEKIVVN